MAYAESVYAEGVYAEGAGAPPLPSGYLAVGAFQVNVGVETPLPAPAAGTPLANVGIETPLPRGAAGQASVNVGWEVTSLVSVDHLAKGWGALVSVDRHTPVILDMADPVVYLDEGDVTT